MLLRKRTCRGNHPFFRARHARVVPPASEDRLLRASMATTVEPRHMSLASLIHLNALERMSAPLAL